MWASLSPFTRVKLSKHCKNVSIQIQNEEIDQNIASRIFPLKKRALIFFTWTPIQTSPFKFRYNTAGLGETICKKECLLAGVSSLNWRFLVIDYPVPTCRHITSLISPRLNSPEIVVWIMVVFRSNFKVALVFFLLKILPLHYKRAQLE